MWPKNQEEEDSEEEDSEIWCLEVEGKSWQEAEDIQNEPPIVSNPYICPKCKGIWLPSNHWTDPALTVDKSLKTWRYQYTYGCSGCGGFSRALLHRYTSEIGMMIYRGEQSDSEGQPDITSDALWLD